MILGIVVAACTALNAMSNLHLVDLSGFFEKAKDLYESIVHSPITFVFGWFDWQLPPRIWIDLAFIWLLVGGVVGRLAFQEARFFEMTGDFSGRPIAEFVDRYYVVPLVVIGWPFALRHYRRNPIVYGMVETPRVSSKGREYIERKKGDPLYDRRTVLLLQAIALLIGVALLVIWNYISKLAE